MSTSFGSLVDELENIIVKFKKINQFFEQTSITDVEDFVKQSEDIMKRITEIEGKNRILQHEKENLLQHYRTLEQKNINLEIDNNVLNQKVNTDLHSKIENLIAEGRKLYLENKKLKHDNTAFRKNEQLMNSTLKSLLKITDDSIALKDTFYKLIDSFQNIDSVISDMISQGSAINVVDETTTQGTDEKNASNVKNMTIDQKLENLKNTFENLSSNPFLLQR